MEGVDIKRVQTRLLSMAKLVADILEKHEIPYMIAYGSLLGAVRHKGFIPWDDDFDFYLFDETYNDAIIYLREELPKDLFLENAESEPLYFHSWAHVKDVYSETECKEFPQDNLYKHKGLCIDLYLTKKMPLFMIESFLNEEDEAYIKRRKNKGLIDTKEYNLRIQKLNKKKQIASTHAETCDEMVFNLLPIYKCHYMREKDVFPLKKYQFEDYYFWGPHCGEKILADIYNDYMCLPSVEKRIGHYSAVKFLQ